MKREIRKTIRFDKSEFEKVEEQIKKTDLDFSSYARQILLNKRVKTKIENDLLFELNKIGVNLNQIARRVNKKEKIQVLTELVAIEKALKELKNGS